MNAKPSLQQLLEVQDYFSLPSPALVEKDWHVTHALAAMIACDIAPFRLVFGGGTALSRAHRLTQRMSEDIDLKIIVDAAVIPSRAQFRQLRDTLTHVLLSAGFLFDPENRLQRVSANESRYTLYRLPYSPITSGEGVLRAEIQIETAFWPVRKAVATCNVKSFVAEAFGFSAEIPAMACASVTEIAAEKFVALTRRAGAELTQLGELRDTTLVRHIYDLHQIVDHCDDDLIALIRLIMHADAQDFGHQFPAYRDNPLLETKKAIEDLLASTTVKRYYTNFLLDMVYGERPNYDHAIMAIKKIGDLL